MVGICPRSNNTTIFCLKTQMCVKENYDVHDRHIFKYAYKTYYYKTNE